MADDYNSLLQERKQKLEERSNTLTDRLKQLEEFRAANTPDVYLAKRPEGMNPMRIIGNYLSSIESRSGLEREQAATEENLTNLLLQMSKQEETNEPSWNEKLAWQQEGFKWDPEQGDFVPMSDEELKTTGSSPAIKAYADRIQAGDMKFTEVPSDRRDKVVVELANRPLSTEEKQTINGIMNELSNFRDLMTPKKFLGLIPLSPKKAEIQTKRKLLGMEIARLYERGRLSDQDREFYLSMLPDEATPLPTAVAQIDAIEMSLKARYAKYFQGEKIDTSGMGMDFGPSATAEGSATLRKSSDDYMNEIW